MASLMVDLAPLPVPTHFPIKHKPGRRQDGFQVSNVKITDLSVETINALVEELRQAMLKEAGHRMQPQTYEVRSDNVEFPGDVWPGSQEALNRR